MEKYLIYTTGCFCKSFKNSENNIFLNFCSQSTENSEPNEPVYTQEPIYDKPFVYQHPSDSELSSASPPPHRTSSPPNGELPSRDQLVRPSMLLKYRGSTAGNCLREITSSSIYCSAVEYFSYCTLFPLHDYTLYFLGGKGLF
jgi:hypothetical protein